MRAATIVIRRIKARARRDAIWRREAQDRDYDAEMDRREALGEITERMLIRQAVQVLRDHLAASVRTKIISAMEPDRAINQ